MQYLTLHGSSPEQGGGKRNAIKDIIRSSDKIGTWIEDWIKVLGV